MNIKTVLYGIGKLLQVLSLFMFVPLLISLFEDPSDNPIYHIQIVGFIVAISVSLILGILFNIIFYKSRSSQNVREGFAIVTLGWVVLAFVGCLPFTIWFQYGATVPQHTLMYHFTNAYFEVMSGLTTTGATIFTDIESVPRGLLFWRSLTHWLGGMGIVTLALALFPAMGVSGYQMFKGEVPGPMADRLQPRLAETARILWEVYVLFTVVEAALLWLGGMTVYDAFAHAFATMATGGFSTKNASIAAYDSDYIHWVITLFMYFAGINFLIHYRVLRGNFFDLKKNPEFKFYTGIILSAIVLTTLILYMQGVQKYESAHHSYRQSTQMTEDLFREHIEQEAKKTVSFYDACKHSAFQVVSMTTTTGFTSADFDLWPSFIRLLLVMLMFFGGSAGSTGGGMKMIRIMTIFKWSHRELKKISQPRLIQPIKIGGKALDEFRVNSIVNFGIIFVVIFSVFSLIMSLFIPDITTATTAVIASLGNIGPGLSGVGAIENYEWIVIPGKWVLIFAMLLGRLEVFTVLVVLRFSNWKR